MSLGLFLIENWVKRKEMVKKILVFCALINILNISNATSFVVGPQTKTIQEKMNSLSNVEKTSTRVNQDMLPTPYNYLLTQPLMTKGIEKYYQRTPVIQTIYAIKNQHNNTYSRAIMMLIDSSKARNNVRMAQRKKEAIVVELAFITMNFNELPKKIITDVLNTNIPFGTLLSDNHVKISITGRTYFPVKCNKELASLTNCNLNNTIYGRTNTIIRTDDNKWLASVVEILPGFLNRDISKISVAFEQL